MSQKPRASGLRLLGWLVGSMVLCLVSVLAATSVLAREPESALLRGVMVAVGVLGFLPLIWVLALMILAEDEFARRIHFYALGLAFAATALFIVAAEYLRRADFIDYVTLPTIFLVMMVAWWLAILFTTRYYR
jgi:hypothetical protein